MRIFIVNLFAGPVFVIAILSDPEPGALSQRLAALRSWPSRQHLVKS
jgi:hypothetical protein